MIPDVMGFDHVTCLFAEQDFNQAISLYTDAISHNPFVAAYYSNRSFAYLKTECFGYALNDANKALELDKSYVKVRSDVFCLFCLLSQGAWCQQFNIN